MTVYIEYAFLENFLLDGVLLWLALTASKTAVRWGRLLFAALFGGGFALLFPLLRLSAFWGFCLKLSVGLLLPMLCFPKFCRKSDWSKYALSATFFFFFTFAFGGAFYGLSTAFSLRRLPNVAVWSGFAFLTAFSLWGVGRFYQKRSVYRCVYDCTVIFGEKRARVKGFWDSGNLARKNGIPVCFLSADIVYRLFGQDILFGGGQVCDEMQILTQAGVRNLPLYKGELEIETKEGIRCVREVYFARATNMISREYKILLHSDVLEGEGKWVA